MPTSRPRFQVTETPEVARALDVAAQRWPDERRSRLLLRLIETGRASLQQDGDEAARRRVGAIDATEGRFSGLFGPGYLDELRHDWPE